MTRLTQKLHPDVRGFTLIELIMTIIVMGIVAIPLSLMITEHVRSVFVLRDLTMARNLAQFEMERVNNMNYANILSASFPNYQGYNYNVTRTVTYVQGDGASVESLKRIRVDVTKSGQTNVLVSVITYVAGNISYGL